MKRYKEAYHIEIVSSCWCGSFRTLRSGSRQGLGEHLVKWNEGENLVENSAKVRHDSLHYFGRQYVVHFLPVGVQELVQRAFCNTVSHKGTAVVSGTCKCVTTKWYCILWSS